MPYTRTKRSRNLGTASSSLSLTSNSDKASNAKAAKISRFFTKLPKEEMSGNSSSESPYQNCLKQVKPVNLSDSACDLDDFRTPQAIKKVSKIAKLPKKAQKKKRLGGKAPIRKFLEDNFKTSDVNADHLQIALALSESSYENENATNSQDKMDNFKKTLEKYGFGYGKSKSGAENRKDFFSIVTSASNKPRNTKSRYRFVTPILKMRTAEEREALISSKVSLILAQNNRLKDCNIQSDPIKLFCESLQDYHTAKIFKLNNLSVEELNREGCFYTKGLSVEACAAPCGYLLKEWGRIPGREVSPVRVASSEEKSSSHTATPQIESPKYVYDGSMSPDLFGPDDESDQGRFGGAWTKSPHKLSPLKANGGILNESDEQDINKNSKKSPPMSFQSNLPNTEDMEVVECFDLTQSDEEDECINLTKSEDLKIFQKNRSSGDFPVSTSSEADGTAERRTNRQSPEHQWQCDTLIYDLTEDYQIPEDTQRSPESDESKFRTSELENRFEPPEIEHRSALSKFKDPELKHRKIEKNSRTPPDPEILSMSSTEGKTCLTPQDQYPEYDSVESHVSEDEMPVNFSKNKFELSLDHNVEKSLKTPPEAEISHLSISSTEESLIDTEFPENSSRQDVGKEENCPTPEHTYQDLTLNYSPDDQWQSDTLEYQFSAKISESEHGSNAPDNGCEAPTNNPELTDAEANIRKSPENGSFRFTESVKKRTTPEWEHHSPEYDWQSDAPSCHFSENEYPVSGGKHASPGFSKRETPKNKKQSAKRRFKCRFSENEHQVSGGKHASPGFTKRNSETPESKNRSAKRRFKRRTSDRSINAPESPRNNRKNPESDTEPPDLELGKIEGSISKSPKNVSTSAGLTDVESGKKSQRMTPEWEYHSAEYDWQSDAVFQFPEDEWQGPEDESTKHDCQTFEPPENVNRDESPEPFVDDWIPSPPWRANEMECYDLSEDDKEEDVKKMEKISTSEDSKLSQESICISDDELNYSSVFATPLHKKKTENDPKDNDKNDVLKQLEPNSAAAKTSNIKQIANSDRFVIKTKNVTPMANYDEMDTPKIVKELDKFGLKPLKRQRGAKLLKYIYESTHPVVEEGVDDDDGRVVKKRRTGSLHFEGVVGDIDEDEWIFEKTHSKRLSSCRIPLHIVWHNFVMSNPKVRENILLYEPVQLEVLHSMLKAQGFKFNIQDLLAFLDKKCVTIRTAQGQRHGKKRP